MSKSSRGRPCEISDDQLETSHAVLLGCLSTYWHEIGWKLSTAKTQRNVRNVVAEFFRRHKSFYRFPFDLETEEPTTSLHPRHLRRQYRQASLDLESFRKEHDQDREQLEEGRKALSQAEKDPETLAIVVPLGTTAGPSPVWISKQVGNMSWLRMFPCERCSV